MISYRESTSFDYSPLTADRLPLTSHFLPLTIKVWPAQPAVGPSAGSSGTRVPFPSAGGSP